jgi:hypothetical protein
VEALRKAQNTINGLLLKHQTYVTLNELYDLLELPYTSESSEVGWNTERLLELEFSAIISEGRPCISVGYSVAPIRGYSRFH